MEIKVGCAYANCGDHRLVDMGDLKILTSSEEIKKEVIFVCYRHQAEMIGQGVLSDHLAFIIVLAVITPGRALKGPGNAKQLQFLLEHKLLESRIEPVGTSKIAKKHAFYATESGLIYAKPFLNKQRSVTFEPCWRYYNDAEMPWWERLQLRSQQN